MLTAILTLVDKMSLGRLPTSCSIPWLSRPRERFHPKSSPSIQPPTRVCRKTGQQ
ncbi:unnamed protein product [Ectocarpus sp. 4 AP-2014]